MRDIARRSIDVDHRQRRVARIGQLVKHLWRDVSSLPAGDCPPLFAEAHLPGALDDEVNLLLLLVMPRHLSTVRFQHHVAHRKTAGLYRRGATHEVARTAPGRISAAGHLVDIGNCHRFTVRVRDVILLVRLMIHGVDSRMLKALYGTSHETPGRMSVSTCGRLRCISWRYIES